MVVAPCVSEMLATLGTTGRAGAPTRRSERGVVPPAVFAVPGTPAATGRAGLSRPAAAAPTVAGVRVGRRGHLFSGAGPVGSATAGVLRTAELVPGLTAEPSARYSPVKWGGRLSNIAVTASLRSLDGRNAEFHAAT